MLSQSTWYRSKSICEQNMQDSHEEISEQSVYVGYEQTDTSFKETFDEKWAHIHPSL